MNGTAIATILILGPSAAVVLVMTAHRYHWIRNIGEFLNPMSREQRLAREAAERRQKMWGEAKPKHDMNQFRLDQLTHEQGMTGRLPAAPLSVKSPLSDSLVDSTLAMSPAAALSLTVAALNPSPQPAPTHKENLATSSLASVIQRPGAKRPVKITVTETVESLSSTPSPKKRARKSSPRVPKDSNTSSTASTRSSKPRGKSAP